MKGRPLPIVITAIIFILTGFFSLAYHANEYIDTNPFKYELIWAIFIRILAIVCGILLLSRVKWARWLAIAWLAYHVLLSLFHSVSEMIFHLVLLAVISILLFLPASSAFFQSSNKRQVIKK